MWLRGERSEIDALTFSEPLVEGAQTATRHEDTHDFAGGRVHDVLLLEVRELAALRLHVRVRDVIGGVRLFAGDNADFCHKGDAKRTMAADYLIGAFLASLRGG